MDGNRCQGGIPAVAAPAPEALPSAPLPLWAKAFRASVPFLGRAGLAALAKALRDDDPRLVQGATTVPPPLQCLQDWPLEGACPWSLAGWLGHGKETVGDGEEFFARLTFEVDTALGVPAGCRFFTNWADLTPRAEMVEQLLAEVDLALSQMEAEREAA